jgi:hypothetical protein
MRLSFRMDCRIKSGNDDVKKRSGGAFFLRPRFANLVIASEAKQSSLQLTMWIASSLPLLAMTTTTTTKKRKRTAGRRIV